MQVQLSDLSVRLALGSVLLGFVVALLGLLVYASRPAQVSQPPVVHHVGNVRSLVNGPSLTGCGQRDPLCIAQRDQIQEVEQKIAARTLEREISILQVEDYSNTTSHRAFTLWAHYLASWVLLVLVVGIVGSGIYMSFLQLKKDLTTGAPNANSIKVSKDGLEINSPVIGLLIFLASAYFFSLYVEKIYPLTFVSSKSPTSPTEPASAASAASANSSR
jgi:hypothetical protein